MATAVKNPKVLNPEARLQQSVARDIKVRQLEEHSKYQADAVAVAKWEVAINQKDEDARRKRIADQIKVDTHLAKTSNTANRRAKLAELYRNDELKYESELNMMGLSFRREHI